MLVPLRAFALQHARTTREAFLEQLSEPHLLLRQSLEPPNLTTNTPWGSTAPASDVWRVTAGTHLDQTPTPTPDAWTTPVSGREAEQPAATPVLIAVRKRPKANAFPDMVTLGRATNNDIILNDDRVSRVQAFFRQEEGRWLVGDMRSTNGTIVNGTPVRDKPVQVAAGSTILLSGAITLLFFDAEALFALLRATLAAQRASA
jgi:hypothetical protein